MTPEELITQATSGTTIAERINAIAAMTEYNTIAPFVETLKDAACEDTERSPTVRTHALHAIRCCPEIIKHDPYIIEFLGWIIDNDSSENVRITADNALTALTMEEEPTAKTMTGEFDKAGQEMIKKAVAQAPFFSSNNEGEGVVIKITKPYKETVGQTHITDPLFNSFWKIEDDNTKRFFKWVTPEPK